MGGPAFFSSLIKLLLIAGATSLKIIRSSEVQIVAPGQSTNLSCMSDEPYTTCSWLLPSGAKCAQLRPNVSTMCRAASDVLFVGNATDCKISVKNLNGAYNGQWACGLDQDSITVERVVELVVGQKGRLEYRDIYGELTLTAGVPQSLICEALFSRPIGKFTWHIGPNPDTNRIININPPVIESTNSQTGVANVSQVLVLVPKPEHNGKQIYCSYIQEDHQKKVLFSGREGIGLRVNFLQVAANQPLIPPITSGQAFNISLEFSAAPRPEGKDIKWEVRGRNYTGSFNLLEDAATGDAYYTIHPLIQMDDARFITVLTIQNVTEEDNNNIFTVSITGRNGLTVTKEFRVMVDRPWPDDDDTPSESDPRTTVYVVLVVIALLLLAIITTLTVLYAKKNQKWCFQDNAPYISPEMKAQEKPLNQPASAAIKHHPYGRPSS